MLGDWDGKEVSLASLISDSLHLHGLEELKLVHESLEWEGPSFSNGLEVLSLLLLNVKELESGKLGELISSGFLNEGSDNSLGVVVSEDTLIIHVLDDESLGLLEGEGTSVNVELWVSWGLIRVRDTGEVLDDTISGLLVESLNVTGLTDLEGSTDMALVELESGGGVDLSGEISVLGVWGNEGDEADLSSEGEELGDLRDSSDVLGSVFSREAKVLVESLSDDISVEDEDLSVVTNEGVNLGLEGTGESGFSSTGESSEPVGGTSGHGVGG